MKTCVFCEAKNTDVVCDDCTLKIVSQVEDFKDLLFLVAEVANATSMSEIVEITGLLSEIYNRLKKKCTEQVFTDLQSAINNFKKDYIEQVLRKCKGNQTEAAKVLNIQRTYVSTLMKSLGIKVGGHNEAS